MDYKNYLSKKSHEEMEKIYQEYSGRLNELKKEQENIFKDFIAQIEKIKLEEIKNRILNSK